MIRAHLRAVLALLAPAVFLPVLLVAQSANPPLLLRNPSLSQDKVAFLYADDVWTVSREGGEAERLTSNGHVVAGPYFSPDGTEIAYSAHLHGNYDVYVAPTEGGVPRRITWHPAGSRVVGWSPDGKNVLITGMEASYRHFLKLFLVHADGSGMPEPLPLPAGEEGSFSPDGKSLAYEPVTRIEPAWKRYKGGNFTKIWIVNLKNLDLVKVPRENSIDSNPVWVGDSVYFLSDRNGPVSLFRYDIGSKAGRPGRAQQRLRPQNLPGRPRRTRLRAVRLHPPRRHRNQSRQNSLHPDSRRTPQPRTASRRRPARRNSERRPLAHRRARRLRGPRRNLYRPG